MVLSIHAHHVLHKQQSHRCSISTLLYRNSPPCTQPEDIEGAAQLTWIMKGEARTSKVQGGRCHMVAAMTKSVRDIQLILVQLSFNNLQHFV